MSAATAVASAPAALITATVLPSEPFSGWSPSFRVRATHTTLAPSPANSAAMAWPMPRLAPVTIATLPVILAVILAMDSSP